MHLPKFGLKDITMGPLEISLTKPLGFFLQFWSNLVSGKISLQISRAVDIVELGK